MHEDVLPVYARIRAAHIPEHHHSGDGYTTPREWWVSCSCGVTIYAGMQGLGSGIPGIDEHDSVEDGWAIHVLSVFAQETPTEQAPGSDLWAHRRGPNSITVRRRFRVVLSLTGDDEADAIARSILALIPDDEEDNPIEQSLLGNDQEDQ